MTTQISNILLNKSFKITLDISSGRSVLEPGLPDEPPSAPFH